MEMMTQYTNISINIVRKYLQWVVDNYPNSDEVLISELLRYSLCVLLKLETRSTSLVVTVLSEECINELREELKASGVLDKPVEFKQGFLESCVHCIEFARKRCR